MLKDFLSSLPSLFHLELMFSLYCGWPPDLWLTGLSALQLLEVSFIEDNAGNLWAMLVALRAPLLHTLSLDLDLELNLQSTLSPTLFLSLCWLILRCHSLDPDCMTIIGQMAQLFPHIITLICKSQTPQHFLNTLEQQDLWPYVQDIKLLCVNIPAVHIHNLLAKQIHLGYPLQSITLLEESFPGLSADERDRLSQYV